MSTSRTEAKKNKNPQKNLAGWQRATSLWAASTAPAKEEDENTGIKNHETESCSTSCSLLSQKLKKNWHSYCSRLG